MKLIDLLVQHLGSNGGWPMGAKNCMQSCVDGEVMFNSEKNFRSGIHLPISDDWDKSIVTKEQYEAALAASKKPEWRGEGIPPEGVECEVKSGKDSWTLCKVVHSSSAGVAFIYLEELSGESSSMYLGVLDSIPHKHAISYFRPIRTEAERKRDDAIDAIQECIMRIPHRDAIAEGLWDDIFEGKIPGIRLE